MSIPILTYHKVSLRWELAYTQLRPQSFERQMTYLHKKGLKGCSLAEYLADPADNKFVITFDDAYENVYTFAFPILEKLGFTATFFVIKDYVGKINTWDVSPGDIRIYHMNETQILALHAAGWEVASHGCRHWMMTLLDDAELQKELSESKIYLENLIHAKVSTFCYPFGIYNEHIVAMTKKNNYSNFMGIRKNELLGVLGRSTVYRVVDNKFSVRRKVCRRHIFHFIEIIKENLIHSFSLITRIKQSISK